MVTVIGVAWWMDVDVQVALEVDVTERSWVTWQMAGVEYQTRQDKMRQARCRVAVAGSCGMDSPERLTGTGG